MQKTGEKNSPIHIYNRLEKKSTIEGVFELLGIMLGLNQYQKMYHSQNQQRQNNISLSPECREAWRKLQHYSEQVRLVSQEGFQTEEDVEAYVKEKDRALAQAIKQRDKPRNKLRNAKIPEVIAQLKSDRDACIIAIKQLRNEKKLALSIIEDKEKVVKIMEAEITCQRENDPYKLIKPVEQMEKKKSRER